MATIASLNVLLTMGTAAFTKGTKTARTALGQLSSSITSLQGALGALGAGISVAGFSILTKSAMESIEETGNLAQTLGITTEALSGLQHAAKLSGSDAEALNAGLAKMTQNLGDAALQGGSVAKALSRLGLDAKTLVAQSPDKAFADIAEALTAIKNPAERASLTIDIFGKRGMELARVLALGRSGIEAMVSRLQKLGGAFSAFDAAKVSAANDALDDMKTVLMGVINQVAIQLSPAIQTLGQLFVEWGTSGGDASKKVATGLAGVGNALALVLDMFDAMSLGIKHLRLMVLGVQDLGLALYRVQLVRELIQKSLMFQDTEGVKNQIRALDMVRDKIAEMGVAIEKEINEQLVNPTSAETFKRKMDDIKQKMNEVAESGAGGAGGINAIDEAATRSAKATDSFTDRVKELQATIGMSTNSITLWKAAQDGVDAGTVEWARNTMAQVDNLKKLVDTLTTLDSSGNIFEQFQQKSGELEQLFNTGQIGARGFLDSMNKLEDAFGKLTKDKARDIFERTRTPLEKLQRQIQEFNDLLDIGELDWDTYTRAVNEARGEYLDFLTAMKTRPDALEFGSAAAESALNAMQDMARVPVAMDAADQFFNHAAIGFADLGRSVQETLGELFVQPELQTPQEGMADRSEQKIDSVLGAGSADVVSSVRSLEQSVVPYLRDIERNTADGGLIIKPMA